MASVLAALLGCAAPSERDPERSRSEPVPEAAAFTDGRIAMGTLLEVELYARDPVEARAVADRVYAEVARLERLVSHYDPDSTVSRLSATAGQGPQPVEPEVAELVREALRYGELSGGAFDVALGAAIAFWRAAGPTAPDRRALARVRRRTGQDKLRLHEDGRVELTVAGVVLDFGGIAKGWALDRVADDVRGSEVDAALLSFGQSSLLAFGAPPGHERWSLALRSPDGGIQGALRLRDQALSVSSSIAAGPGVDGEPGRGAIVDPRTSRPVAQRAMAAVVARDAAAADALSTALLVLDPYSAIKRIEAIPGVEAMIVEPTGQATWSSGWVRATDYRPVSLGAP